MIDFSIKNGIDPRFSKTLIKFYSLKNSDGLKENVNEFLNDIILDKNYTEVKSFGIIESICTDEKYIQYVNWEESINKWLSSCFSIDHYNMNKSKLLNFIIKNGNEKKAFKFIKLQENISKWIKISISDYLSETRKLTL